MQSNICEQEMYELYMTLFRSDYSRYPSSSPISKEDKASYQHKNMNLVFDGHNRIPP